MNYIFIFILFALIIYLKTNQAKILGFIGEYRVSKVISNINPSFVIMNDLLLPKEDRTTSQVDHVVLTTRGIFVIETKNYDAKIYGHEHQRDWKVYYKGKKEYRLHNPIYQNYGHIKSLERILISYPNIPYYGIVVFDNHATLKVTSTTPVILLKDLDKTIRKIYMQGDYVLSEDNVRHIKRRLEILNNNTSEKQKEHVERVKELKR